TSSRRSMKDWRPFLNCRNWPVFPAAGLPDEAGFSAIAPLMRLLYFSSLSLKYGKVDIRLSSSMFVAYIPESSGTIMFSWTSSPSLLLKKLPTDTSVYRGTGFLKRSRPADSLPETETRSVVRKGTSSVGTPSTAPFGSADNLLFEYI